MMRVLGVIPARLGSIRLPHKPLQLLAGEPLITRVIQRVMEHGLLDLLVVATDAPTIAEVAGRSGVSAGPKLLGASCTITARPVFDTEAVKVSRSSGEMRPPNE